MRVAVSVLAVSTLVTFVAGCGGGDSPTAPSPTPTPAPTPIAAPQSPSNLRAAFSPALGRADITLTWTSPSAPAGAGYVVELGRTPGATDLGQFDAGPALSYTASALPSGRVYARVRTRAGDTVSAPSTETAITVFDLREYIDALFLGAGPLTPSDGDHGCAPPGYLSGFPRGTSVSLLIASTIPSDKMDTIRSVASRAPDVSRGGVSIALTQTTESNPQPQRNQAAIAVGDPGNLGCTGNRGTGCTASSWESRTPGVYLSSRSVLASAAATPVYAHELGHGVFGLCHVDGERIGDSRLSLMSAGPVRTELADTFSNYDVAAMAAVYGAGLAPGATRSDFVRQGLVTTASPTHHRLHIPLTGGIATAVR